MQAVVLITLFFSGQFLAADPQPRPRRAITEMFNRKWNATAADKLKRDLMLNYDKFMRPSYNENVTVVELDLQVNHIELDEARSIMTAHCFVKIVWDDNKLKWNPDEYSGIKVMHLADHEIWQPDLVPYNQAEGSLIDVFGNTNAIVTNSGKVMWMPPAAFRIFCELDLRKWPYDTQTCLLKIGSWTYTGEDMDLQLGDDGTFENILPNAEWDFINILRNRNVIEYSCCDERFIDLTFTMVIKRKSLALRALIIAPITAIVFMTLTTFWLPPASSEKITLGGMTALIITIYLLYFIQKVAVMTTQTPYIVTFYSWSLHLVAFSIVTSVVIINVASSPRTMNIPWIIKRFITSRVGRILLLQHSYELLSHHSSRGKQTGDDEMGDSRLVLADETNDEPEAQQDSSSSQREWRQLAVVLDRIMFLVYCLLFSCFAIAYLS